jgi:ArsR family transcriptional regulator, zinc-responsive transcriptional repressor
MISLGTLESHESLRDAEQLLKALAHTLRLAIVHELTQGPRCVHDLVDTLGVPQPLVSQHLRVLRSARLVAGRRRGQEMEYTLQDQHVSHIVEDAIQHTQERKTP